MQVHKKANRYLFYLLVRKDNTLQKKMWNFLLYCCRYVVATTPKSLFELDEQNFKQHVQTFTRPQQKLTHTHIIVSKNQRQKIWIIFMYIFSQWKLVFVFFSIHPSIFSLHSFKMCKTKRHNRQADNNNRNHTAKCKIKLCKYVKSLTLLSVNLSFNLHVNDDGYNGCRRSGYYVRVT